MFNLFKPQPNSLNEKIKYLESKEKYLSVFQEIILTIVANLDFEEVTQKIVNLIIKNFHYTSSVLFIIPEGEHYIYSHTVSDILVIKNVINKFGKSFREHRADLLTDNSLVVKTARERKTFEGRKLSDFVSPTLSSSLSDFTQATLRIKNTISIPLISQQEVLGVIMFNSQRAEFLAEEKEALESFAKQLAIVIKNSLLYKTSQEQYVQLQTRERAEGMIFSITNQLITSLDPKIVAKRTVDIIPKETGMFGAVLCLLDDDLNTLRVVAVTETVFEAKIKKILGQDYYEFPGYLDQPAKYNNDVVHSFKENSLKISTSFETAFSPSLPAILARSLNILINVKSIVSLPIKIRDRVIGVISFVLTDKKPTQLLSEDLSLMKVIATQIGVALDNASLYTKVEAYSIKLKEETEEITKQKDEIAEQLRRERDMMDILGHELRTPLTTGKNAIFLLEMEVKKHSGDVIEKNKVLELTNKAIDNLRRETKLLETVLSSTKIENNRLQISFGMIECKSIVNNTLEAYEHESATKNIKLSASVPNQDIYCYGGKEQVQEIVDNLVSNALKYTTKGSITIDLYTDSEYLIFSVTDTGEGIPDNEIPHLGKKFYRINNYLNTDNGGKVVRAGGTGIGLYVVYGLTKMMNGKVTIKSKIGEGSTFSVYLPIKPAL